jgi:hypothetical protein
MANKSLLISGGDGTAIPTGMVGEVVKSSINTAVSSGTGYSSLTSISLTAGTWLISAVFTGDFNVDPAASISISDNGSASHAGLTGYTSTYMVVTKRSDAYHAANIGALPYTCSTSKTIHLVLYRTTTASTTFTDTILVAIRIA